MCLSQGILVWWIRVWLSEGILVWIRMKLGLLYTTVDLTIFQKMKASALAIKVEKMQEEIVKKKDSVVDINLRMGFEKKEENLNFRILMTYIYFN
jgi:hypothetical protein